MILRRAPYLLTLIAAMLLMMPHALAAPKRLALITHHDRGGPGTAPLHFTQDDARRMGELLLEMGDVNLGDLTHLSHPTPSQLEGALAELQRHAQGEADGAFIIFYYSGHADHQGLWLGDEHYPLTRLQAALKATEAQIQLIILDACASGALTQEKGGKRTQQFMVKVPEAPELQGQVILASSAADEASQESDRVGGGIFTHHLIAGMRGAADRSSNGIVTLEELYAYAYHQTLFDTMGSLGGTQHPTYKVDLSGQGELVMSRPKMQSTSLYFPSGSAGTYLIFEKKERLFIGELALDGQATRLGLPEGHYLVQKREADHLLAAEIAIQKGSSVRLEEGDMQRLDLREDFTKGVIHANRLRAMGPTHQVDLFMGMQRFYNTPIREDLVPQTPLLGLSYRRMGWPRWPLALRLDLALAQLKTDQTIDGQTIPIEFREVALSPALMALYALGPLQVYGGPRLSALYLERTFLPPLNQPKQTLATLSPGLMAGMNMKMARRWGLTVEGRSHYLYYAVGDENLSLGYGEVSLGFWGRF